MGLEGLRLLIEALNVNSTLRSLDLSSNVVGEQAGVLLAAVLRQNTTLQSLRLSSCGITEAGVVALVEALSSNQTLLSLDLGGNSLGQVGECAIASELFMSITAPICELSFTLTHPPHCNRCVVHKQHAHYHWIIEWLGP